MSALSNVFQMMLVKPIKRYTTKQLRLLPCDLLLQSRLGRHYNQLSLFNNQMMVRMFSVAEAKVDGVHIVVFSRHVVITLTPPETPRH